MHTQPRTFRLAPVIGENLTPSPTLYINERVNEMWAAGETVYHLGFGESRFPVHPKLAAALAANAHRKSYLPGPGLPALREAIANFYTKRLGETITPDRVITGPGSKALLFAFQMAVDGDLILPTPSWVSYAPQARLLGKSVHYVKAEMAQHHPLSVDALRAALAESDQDQHLLVLTSPNNPTSQVFGPALLAQVAEVCRAHNVLVLSDEIYAYTTYNDPAPRSIRTFYPEGTILLGGLSKHLSLGGWRLGMAIVPPGEPGRRLLQAANKVGGEIWSCASAPVQYAAVTAYSDDPDINAYMAECTHLHRVRTQHLWRGLAELDIPCAEPVGGFYLFPNFEAWRPQLAARGIHTSADLARHLLDEWRLATLPGLVFGAPTEELSLRLSSSYLDMETDEKAQHLLDLHRSGVDDEALLREHHPMMNQALAQFRAFLASL